MRLRCRTGIHEWAHLGYVLFTDTSYGKEMPSYWVHRYCTECGKRWRSGSLRGTPPDVTCHDDGTYTDHSRPKENR